MITSLTTFTSQLDGGLGIVLRELISEAAHDPTLAVEFQTRFGQAKQVEVIGMFQRAMARGEIPAQPIDPYVLELPAALTIHQLLLAGSVPSARAGRAHRRLDHASPPRDRPPRRRWAGRQSLTVSPPSSGEACASGSSPSTSVTTDSAVPCR